MGAFKIAELVRKKLNKEIRSLKRKMKKSAQEFDFDKAAEYRDLIRFAKGIVYSRLR